MKYFFLTLLIFLICSCNQERVKQKVVFRGRALGTYYNVVFYPVSESNDTSKIHKQIKSLLKEIESIASVYDSMSLVSLINRNVIDTVTYELSKILNCAMEVNKISGGYFDITVAPLVEAWGFKTYELREPSKQIIDSIRQFVGMDLICLEKNIIRKKDPRVKLDFNAIAKGYAVDVIAEWFEKHNINSYIVEIGGEVRAGNLKSDGSKWIVAIEKPAASKLDPQQEYQRMYINNISVATSGNYRNYFEKDQKRYSHTIDPKTGFPVIHNMLSATVVASSCMLADALATACMALGPDKAYSLCEQLDSVECYFILSEDTDKFKILYTKNFDKYLFQK